MIIAAALTTRLSARSATRRNCFGAISRSVDRGTHISSGRPCESWKMSPIRSSASSVAIDQQPHAVGFLPPECTNTARSESSSGHSDGSLIWAPPMDAMATLRSTEPSRKTRIRFVVTTSCLGTPTSPVAVVLPSFTRMFPPVQHLQGRKNPLLGLGDSSYKRVVRCQVPIVATHRLCAVLFTRRPYTEVPLSALRVRLWPL